MQDIDLKWIFLLVIISYTCQFMNYLKKNLSHRKVPTQLQINLQKREKRLEKLIPKPTGPKRDVSAQYFGHYLDPNEVFKFKSTEESIRF